MLKAGQAVEDVMEDMRELWYEIGPNLKPPYTVLRTQSALVCLHCTGHVQQVAVADSRGTEIGSCSGRWFDLENRVDGGCHISSHSK